MKQARIAFGQNVVDDAMGKHPAYVEALQFDPATRAGPFADTPVIPGSPKRAAGAERRQARWR
ncbi:MAG: NAD-glutamate dehydrogenase [Pseudomonadota bacterium]|nr:NAD-glutamate dehydrogenase [Pseudomonadota bacterium]